MPILSCISQENRGMLMFQIENKQFKKTNYDKNGLITGSQVLKVGNIKKKLNGYSLNITTKIYNKKGNLKSEKSFNYLCDLSQNGSVFMAVFPFINTESNKINITVLSKNFLYPNSFEKIKTIDNFSFFANYKTGVLGINTKTFINITDRTITKSTDGNYNLTGNIEINTFIGSLNILSLNYTSFEIINVVNGIIFQKFSKIDNSYFTIELNN